MAKNITLTLSEDYLGLGEINLFTGDYETADPNDFETYEHGENCSNLIIRIHRDSGEILYVSLPEFEFEINGVIKNLRGNPLPWTFSLASMNIKEKPLEDVLLAVYKKFKNVKIIGG